MNQRQRILELVKNDSITIEQGMELMSALETRSEISNRLPTRLPAPPAWKTSDSSVKVGRPLASGSGQLSFDQIVQLGVHGIKPNYIQELRKAGLDNVPFAELMQLIVHQIPVSYVLELRELEQQLEVEPLSVAQIVQLGIHRISASYALKMRQFGIEHGFAPLTVDQIVQLGIHKIEPSYVLELLKTGAFNLSTLPAAEVNLEDRRAKLKEKPEKSALMSRAERLEAQAARNEAKREREIARDKRRGLSGESNDELDDLNLEMSDTLEPNSEAELEANEPKAAVRRWFGTKDFFNINDFVDSSLPMTLQKAMLEEMLQDINADIGVATNEVERAALLDVHAQIIKELGRLPAS